MPISEVAPNANALASPRRWAMAIVIVAYFVTLAVNWPGHLEFDSIRQLLEGRRGVYSNWHPPIMSWMLGVFDAILPGGALFVVFDATLAFGALVCLLWLVKKPSWWAVPATLVSVALPQLFLFQAIVWKDMLFADALVAGFVALAQSLRCSENSRARFVCLAASVLLLALAVLARQNGIIALPCAALALLVADTRASGWRHGLLYAVAFALACGSLAWAVNATLQLRAGKIYAPIQQVEDLQLYDIGGMLKRNPAIRLRVLEKDRPALAQALRNDGPRLYTPIGHDRLTDDPAIRRWLNSSAPAVNVQWRALLLSHFRDWFAVRAQDFGWVFLSQHPKECLTYAVGVMTIPADLKAAKLAYRYDARDTWLNDTYAAPLLQTPALSHPWFAAAGLLCLVLLVLRRRPADIAMAGLLIAAILYTISYFVVSIACQYRYLFALDLSAIAPTVYLLADLRLRDVLAAFRRRGYAPPAP